MDFNLRRLFDRFMVTAMLPTPEDKQARNDRIARKVVMRNAEGSVRLTTGRYRTQRDCDESYAKAEKASF